MLLLLCGPYYLRARGEKTMKRKPSVIRKLVIGGDEPGFGIGVASRLTKLPVWTLRILDKNAIVSPRKSRGNTRLYSNKDVQKLVYVQYLMKVRKVNVGGLKVLKDLREIGG